MLVFAHPDFGGPPARNARGPAGSSGVIAFDEVHVVTSVSTETSQARGIGASLSVFVRARPWDLVSSLSVSCSSFVLKNGARFEQ